MAIVSVHFPSKEEMETKLSSPEFFKEGYFQTKGVIAAISKLAVKVFADREVGVESLAIEAEYMVLSLEQGEDLFTGEKVPKIPLLQESTRLLMALDIKVALLACATRKL